MAVEIKLESTVIAFSLQGVGAVQGGLHTSYTVTARLRAATQLTHFSPHSAEKIQTFCSWAWLAHLKITLGEAERHCVGCFSGAINSAVGCGKLSVNAACARLLCSPVLPHREEAAQKTRDAFLTEGDSSTGPRHHVQDTGLCVYRSVIPGENQAGRRTLRPDQ